MNGSLKKFNDVCIIHVLLQIIIDFHILYNVNEIKIFSRNICIVFLKHFIDYAVYNLFLKHQNYCFPYA